MAHTRGPWVAVDDEIVADNGDVRVADVPRGDGVNPTEWQANAHLIAAAPQLLESLKLALAHVSDLREAWARGVIRESDNLGGTRSNRNVDVQNALIASIRKAEGKDA